MYYIIDCEIPRAGSPKLDLIWGPGILEDALEFIKLNHNGEVPNDDGELWYDGASLLKLVRK